MLRTTVITPAVLHEAPEPYTLKIRCGHGVGGRGALWQKDKSATLATNNDQTLFQPAYDNTAPAYAISKEGYCGGEKANFNFAVNEEVAPTMQASGPSAVAKPRAFGVCSKKSKGMLSDNPKVGFYEAKTSRTLDRSGGNAVTSDQGGICVVAPARQIYDVRFTSEGTKNARGHCYKTDISRCLDTGGGDPNGNHGGIAIVEDVKTSYCASTGYHMEVVEDKAPALMARDYKDPKIVSEANDAGDPVYIVRRLTPEECLLLQGLPEWWCDGLEIPDPCEEEVAFWMDVWATWQNLNGHKPKTEKQVRKWLANPYSDSAVYKLAGNGVAIPVVYFVLAGIEWAARKEAES